MKNVFFGVMCALLMLPCSLNAQLKGYPIPDRSKVPAFPGADGAGKYTTGGARWRSLHRHLLSR